MESYKNKLVILDKIREEGIASQEMIAKDEKELKTLSEEMRDSQAKMQWFFNGLSSESIEKYLKPPK